MLMMVLGWKGMAKYRSGLLPASRAYIYPGMRRWLPWVMQFVEHIVIRLIQQTTIFVEN